MNTFYEKNLTFFDKISYQIKQKNIRRNVMSVSFAILFAMLLSFIIITSLGTKPAAFFAMFTKAFDWSYNAEQFAVQLCIYVIAALAFSFSMKVGIFNIGISGQMLAGGSFAFLITSLIVGKNENFSLPGGQIITILLSIIGATAVALSIGVLKIYFKVNEVVSAILLNWIILFIVGTLVRNHLLDTNAMGVGIFKSLPMHTSFTFWHEGQFWGWEWSIATTVIAVVAIWALLKFTVFGHKLKTTGQNPFAAQNFGYNKNALQLASFAISGVLAGLLAVIVYTATYSRALDLQPAGGTALSTIPAQGFDGIAIGLIALNNPISIVLVSFIFTFPNVGAAPAGLPASTIQLIVGIMMYVVAIYTLLNYFKPWRFFMQKKYEKVNSENFMNFENEIFARNEQYKFQYKKAKNEIIDKKVRSMLSGTSPDSTWFWIVKIFFVKPFMWVSLSLFDIQFKSTVQELKQKYFNDRQNISSEFRINCVITLLNYWKHNPDNMANDFNKWITVKSKINKWHIEAMKVNNFDLEDLNIEKEFTIIEERLNYRSSIMGAN